MSRGARVTLSDPAQRVDGADALRARRRRRSRSARIGAALFAAADLVVLSPGVPPRPAGDRGRATRRRAGHRRSRARVALADRPRHRDHRHEGQVDDDDADGADAAGRRASTSPPAAISARRCRRRCADRVPTPLHVVEVSSFQLETTDTFHPWIAVLRQSLARPPRPARVVRGVRRAPRRGSSRTRPPTTGPSSTPTIRRRWRWRAACRARRFDFALDAPLVDGVDRATAATSSGATTAWPSPLMPLSSVRLPGRHLLGDVLAAAAVGCVAGVPPAAMQRAVEGFTRPRARARARRRDRRRARSSTTRRPRTSRPPAASIESFDARRRRHHGRPLQGRRLRGPARRRRARVRRRSSRSARPRR